MSNFSFTDNVFSDVFSLAPELFFDQKKTVTTKYPPINVSSSPDDSEVKIEIAVAGFDPSNITIEEEENRLIVSGDKGEEEQTDYKFSVRQIGHRSFKRIWTKKANYRCESAVFSNGILTITLAKTKENIRSIPITDSSGSIKRLTDES